MDGLIKTSDGSALRFYEEAARNNFVSDKLGRPIYDQVAMVEVISPGNNSFPVFEIERIFSDEAGIPPRQSMYYARFETEYKAWKTGNIDADMRGTPIDQWPAIDKTMAASLREARIFTVEGLANLPDEKLRVIGPGGLAWRAKAIAYLQEAAGNAPSEALAAENAQLRQELADVKASMGEMNANMEKLQAALAAGAVTTAPPGKPAKPAPATPVI